MNNDNFTFGGGPPPDGHHGDLPNSKLPKGGPTPEERQRMVDDATREFAKLHKAKPLTDTEVVLRKAKAVHTLILRTAKFLMEKEKESGIRRQRRDIRADMAVALSQTYRDEFIHWSKDELIELAVSLHVGICLENMNL